MEYIGGVDGMNFTPISNYNNYLKNTMSFDVNSNMDFASILDKQTAQLQDAHKLQGGVQMNNFDDVLAQNSIQQSENGTKVGNLLDNLGEAVGNSLQNTNSAIKTAEKAQESFAMGENISVHDVMIAAEKANLNFSMTMQLRNKLLSAYQELNQVRV